VNTKQETSTTLPGTGQQFLTVAEVAQLLRKKERTIREMCYSRRIPHYKVGKTILFKLGVILDWLDVYCKVDPIINPSINPSLNDLKKKRKQDSKPPVLVSIDRTVTRD